jgi:hypothetical protein
MRRLVLVITAALTVLTGALSQHAAAMSAATPSGIALAATSNRDIVQKTAVVCGHYGCRHYGPRRYYWRKAPAPVVDYPPACAPNYHYACQRGPLGYGACACWPY